MGTTSSSPYEIGEPVKTRLTSRGWHWVQHEGKRRAGTTSTRSSAAARGGVSIFKASLKELSQDKATLAKHAFAKTKMLRHPHILEFIEGNDDDSEVACPHIMFATTDDDEERALKEAMERYPIRVRVRDKHIRPITPRSSTSTG